MKAPWPRPSAPTRRQRIRNIVVLGIAFVAAHSTLAAADPGSREERGALFDYLLRTTLDRTAFSPYTAAAAGIAGDESIARHMAREMLATRDELLAADTDAKLYYALARLSNLRRDSHLRLQLVEGGLRLPAEHGPGRLGMRPDAGSPVEPESLHAALKFRADYARNEPASFFVSDVGAAVRQESGSAGVGSIRVGDRLVAVNGVPIERYVATLRPFCRASSRAALRWQLARALPMKLYGVPPSAYRGDAVSYELESSAGKRYHASLPYQPYREITWQGHDDHYTGRALARAVSEDPGFAGKDAQYALDRQRYPGFRWVFSTRSYDLYENRTRRTLLLKWHHFDTESAIADTERLLAHARQARLWEHALIFDATHASGGDHGVFILQRLQPKPFRMTFGNLRVSDITPALVAQLAAESRGSLGRHAARPPLPAACIQAEDDGRFLLDWLVQDAAAAVETRQAYTSAVPFKSYFLPKHSDGMVYPAREHFRGPMVLWLSPHGCSHVDQFAAMFIDNRLGLSVGMPAGGCSNTWEWEEVLTFPGREQPILRYMWTVGHTLRPNGQVLEGNPARPGVVVPQTRENYLAYYSILLRHSFEYIEAQRGGAVSQSPSQSAPPTSIRCAW